MTQETKKLTLIEAQAEATSSVFRTAGYCAMPHPTQPGSCTRQPGHERHDDPEYRFHRDWYRRESPLGPWLDWSDEDYA